LKIAVTSRGIAGRAFIEAHLGAPVELIGRVRPDTKLQYSVIAGWGNKKSGSLARELAAEAGVPCLLLEDGFIRSVGDGTDPQALSLAVDDTGIYYDAQRPSRLEALIAAGCPEREQARTRALVEFWRSLRVSKYNQARDCALSYRDYVLVADQTFGDASIDGALATRESFMTMLEAALDEHPHRKILLKVHPDVFAGRKHGHFDRLTKGIAERVEVVGRHYHAPDLIEPACAVYSVSSQIGFEALLWGKPVHSFGMPFYAGWGLTHDSMRSPSRRQCAASLEDLAHAALIAYIRYVDPETGKRCEVETVLEHIALQRRMRARFPEEIHAIGFSRWKKPIVRAFLGGSQVRFARSTKALPSSAQAVAVWGSKDHGRAGDTARILIRIEDGFIRSVGLGAKLVKPSSWVLDPVGVYYDAKAPSRMEQLLERETFGQALLERASRLRTRIVREQISKYNLSGSAWKRPQEATRVILVAGQVEGDASLMRGAEDIRTNFGLLEAVRRAEPDAYIVFKPHPDVVAGLREGAVPRHMTTRLCDEVIEDVSIVDAVQAVDEVHVMTSLTGFEALLHGKEVVVHGAPFYAGWGLTNDRIAMPRRTRRVTLDMLVAAALILYPTYISQASGRFTTPERILDELTAARAGAHSRGSPSNWLSPFLKCAAWWRRLNFVRARAQ
jgi:capsular polysaccharide export protein